MIKVEGRDFGPGLGVSESLSSESLPNGGQGTDQAAGGEGRGRGSLVGRPALSE